MVSAAAAATVPVGGRDRISNLPDFVLQHMLSFLPAQDAVRTCVLAKGWRHLWKSTTGLRLVCGGTNEPESVEEIQAFVDHLLRLQISGGTPLDTCEFRVHVADDGGDDMSRLDLWIRIALQCKVQVLVLRLISEVDNPGIFPTAGGGHPFFITQYLKKLELQGLDLEPSRLFLDFSFCPDLEYLEIVDCYLEAALFISSQSLKHLTVEDCSFDDEYRMLISAPNLVSLWLHVREGRTPSLQSMPSVITAFIKINSSDDCDSTESDDDDYGNQSILLHGLSEVWNLSLIANKHKMLIFRRDLKFCSSFINLKSLLLDEYWCKPADFSALACLLKLSPVLEKFTLQLDSKGPKHKVEIKLSCKPLGLSTEISQHLKTLEVKCKVYDKRVGNVLTFLSRKLNIFNWLSYLAVLSSNTISSEL